MDGHKQRPGPSADLDMDLCGDMDAGPEVERIEQVLRELAGEGGGVPPDVPLAEEPFPRERRGGAPEVEAEPVEFGVPDFLAEGAFGEPLAPGEAGGAAGGFGEPVDPSDERSIAIAEPLTAHDASLIALGDNVRQVTQLIESVGRTLEAQNQRSLRLMERLESVAKALECLPEECDRNLEGLDAIEEAIHKQQAPLEQLGDRLSALPDVVQAVRDSNESTRELFGFATRALAGRMAFTVEEARRREREEGKRRRWRVLALTAFTAAAFVGGAAMTATDAGKELRRGLASILASDRPVVEAAEGERAWRVTGLKQLPAPPRTVADGAAPAAECEPLGTDEEKTR